MGFAQEDGMYKNNLAHKAEEVQEQEVQEQYEQEQELDRLWFEQQKERERAQEKIQRLLNEFQLKRLYL
jgi:hypothetical protein